MNYEIETTKKDPWKIKLPKGIEEYIHDRTGHPIIYDRFLKRAFCFKCGKYFNYVTNAGDLQDAKSRTLHGMNRFRANDWIRCPLCGHEGKAVPHTRNIFVETQVATGWREKDALYINFIGSIYAYKKECFNNLENLNAKIYIEEIVRISRDKQVCCCRWGNEWYTTRTPHVDVVIKKGYPVAHQSLGKSIKSSFLKYAGVSVEADTRPNMDEIVKRLVVNAKYPQLEYLRKAGLNELERSLVWDIPTYLRPNWKKKDMPGVLGITSQDIDKLRQWKMFEVDYIASYKEIKKYHKQIRKKDMEDFFAFFENIGVFKHTRRYAEDLKGLDPVKTARYLERLYLSSEPHCDHGYYGYGRGDVLREYADYIDQLRELKYPQTDYYLYPKDFQAAHETVSEEYREKEDRIKQEQKKNLQKQYEEKYLPALLELTWQDEKYLIRPLKDYIEFSQEGKNNNNCVASYFDRAAEGRTSIFVIREVADPEKSLATVEVRDGRMVQCWESGNRTPKPEVRAFAKKWMQEIVLKKKKKGAAAPAA